MREGAGGLIVHDSVWDAVSTVLRLTDPERHKSYCVAAWRQLRAELVDAAPHELWRYTAEILGLLQSPILKEAFFPTGYPEVTVEPAVPGDEWAIWRIMKHS